MVATRRSVDLARMYFCISGVISMERELSDIIWKMYILIEIDYISQICQSISCETQKGQSQGQRSCSAAHGAALLFSGQGI